ncbi:hypothetical protein DFH08DRAFT_329411, partial [Mycena albidolilacea]
PTCQDHFRRRIPPQQVPWLAGTLHALLLSNEAQQKRASLQKSVVFPRSPKCAPCAKLRSHMFEKGMGGCTTVLRSSNGGRCTARLSPKSGRPVGWTAAVVNTRGVRRGVFYVRRRQFAERMVHLALRAAGYRRAQFVKRCSCGRRHREFVRVRPNGSLDDIERIIRRCLKKIGEGDAPQLLFHPQKR